MIVHAMQGGRRDFASAMVMRPQTYELIVDDDVADDAVRTLGWDRLMARAVGIDLGTTNSVIAV